MRNIFLLWAGDLLLLLGFHPDEFSHTLLGDHHGLPCNGHLLGGRQGLDLALVNPSLVVLAGLAQDNIGVTLGGGLLRGNTGGGAGKGTEGLAGLVLEDVGLLDGGH